MITIENIKSDIIEYQARIEKAQDQVAGLPAGYLSYPQHKKRAQARRQAEDEIKHCRGLIEYAREGILLRESGSL